MALSALSINQLSSYKVVIVGHPMGAAAPRCPLSAPAFRARSLAACPFSCPMERAARCPLIREWRAQSDPCLTRHKTRNYRLRSSPTRDRIINLRGTKDIRLDDF